MPKKTLRVPIPTKPADVINLLKAVRTKHLALGATSPLAGLDWAVITPALDAADTHDKEAVRLASLTEKEYRERDKTMPDVNESLRASRDILLGLNRKNPKVLGDFGFTVDDTPKAKKPAPPGS